MIAAAAAIVLAGCALRLWNIGAGIPYNVGQDEPHIMDRVVHMMKTGDFNPHFFDWPSLTFYLNLVVSAAAFLFGAMRGAWNNLDQIGADQMYLAGRQFTACLGAATVWLTFAAGRRWGTGVGLFAAALMAVMPLHVRESHYVLTDVPAAFFTTLSLLLALRAVERGTTRAMAWAGVAVGLAASCKYNGSMAIVFPLIAAVEAGGSWRLVLGRAGIVSGAAVAGFLVGTPYAVLDLPAFLNDYARLAAIFAGTRPGEAGWSVYLKHLRNSIAMPAAVAIACGLVIAAARGVTRAAGRGRAFMLLAFVAVYFTVMARSGQLYARYLLPLLPILAIASGIAVTAAVQWVSSRAHARWIPRAAGAAIAVVILAGPSMNAVSFNRGLAVRSTIDLAYSWIVGHAPRGSKFAVEYGALRLAKPYEMVLVRSLWMRTADQYREDGVDYLLAAAPEFQMILNEPTAHPEVSARYRDLLSSAEEVASFDPSDAVSGPRLRIIKLPN